MSSLDRAQALHMSSKLMASHALSLAMAGDKMADRMATLSAIVADMSQEAAIELACIKPALQSARADNVVYLRNNR